MPKPKTPQYVAIAHVWPAGGIDRLNVLNNRAVTTHPLAGEYAPQWLRERVALMMKHEANKRVWIGTLGMRFEEDELFVLLKGTEYRELMKIVRSPGSRPDEKKQRATALARIARFKPRIEDPLFSAWVTRLLRGLR